MCNTECSKLDVGPRWRKQTACQRDISRYTEAREKNGFRTPVLRLEHTEFDVDTSTR